MKSKHVLKLLPSYATGFSFITYGTYKQLERIKAYLNNFQIIFTKRFARSSDINFENKKINFIAIKVTTSRMS